jgi:plastocyanin
MSQPRPFATRWQHSQCRLRCAASASDTASAASASQTGAAATSDSGATVAKSKALPGEEDLASRKGSYKYGADGADAGPGDTAASAGASGDAASAGSDAGGDPAPADDAASTPDFDGDGVLEGTNEGEKPEMMSGPREGGADDLKQIKGIGPKLEQAVNSIGVYHFDQIASWSDDEVAWVNANLIGFKGRVTRDKWVEQAKTLAAGGETEFSKKVEKGGVYE